MTPIYLDHAASTPVRPAVWDAMRRAAAGNPASAHHAGRAARRPLEDARERVAVLLEASPEEVIFTSGATESNNAAVFGLAGDVPAKVVTTAIEHPCVTEPMKQLAARGFIVEYLPVDGRGVVVGDLPADARFASILLVNHETGAIQPVQRLAATVPVHTDAAQAVGKIPVSFRRLGVAALTASAHKFGGPQGVGLLLLKAGTAFAPRTFGGHQQRGRRPGTEPVALAVGLAVALEEAIRDMAATAARLTRLRAQLFERLCETVAPVVLNGPAPGDADSAPHVLNLSFPGCRADLLLMSLDLAGVACSTGSACSSGSLLPSPVLAAMQVPDAVLRSALRFSLGEPTTEAEIVIAAERIAASVAAGRAGDFASRLHSL